ncbi:MAG: hypothetical protein J6U21_15930 [Bacteroidales bacterium]|nr:hypothetical protein [Bacteroidales bacterium]
MSSDNITVCLSGSSSLSLPQIIVAGEVSKFNTAPPPINQLLYSWAETIEQENKTAMKITVLKK